MVGEIQLLISDVVYKNTVLRSSSAIKDIRAQNIIAIVSYGLKKSIDFHVIIHFYALHHNVFSLESLILFPNCKNHKILSVYNRNTRFRYFINDDDLHQLLACF